MENRRPPRSNSTDRKPYFGTGRSTSQNRSNNRPGNGRPQGDKQVSRGPDNRGPDNRGADNRGGGGQRPRSNDSRWRDGRTDGRTDGRFARKDGFSPGGQNRRPDTRRGPARGPKLPEPEKDLVKITSDAQI